MSKETGKPQPHIEVIEGIHQSIQNQAERILRDKELRLTNHAEAGKEKIGVFIRLWEDLLMDRFGE